MLDLVRSEGRIADILLLLSLLLILGAAGLIAAQGRLGGMAAAFRGVGPQAGDRGPAVAALALVVFSAAFAAVEGTFHANVTVWAAEEAARNCYQITWQISVRGNEFRTAGDLAGRWLEL